MKSPFSLLNRRFVAILFMLLSFCSVSYAQQVPQMQQGRQIQQMPQGLQQGRGTPANRPAAQAPVVDSTTVPLKLVDGHMVIAVDLVSKASNQSVSLLVDLDAPHSLALQKAAMKGLKLADGETSVTLSTIKGFKARVSTRGLAPYAGRVDMAEVTALYGSALDDRPLVGTVGVAFLKNYHVILDIQAGKLELLAPGKEDVRPQGVVIHPLDASDGHIRIPVNRGDERIGAVMLSSAYDSYIDAVVAKSMGAPAGNVMDIKLVGSGGEFTLSDYVAFRPAGVFGKFEAVLTAGVNLLKNFRVEIDWANGYVSFAQTQKPSYPKGDFAFIRAEVAKSSDGLADFMEKYPDNRLAKEAAGLLVDWRMQENADDASLLEAARWYRDTGPKGLKGAYTMALMDRFAKKFPKRSELIIKVGEQGLEVASKDLDKQTLYKLHDQVGQRRLAAGDVHGAWKNFLSAVFGMPKDAGVNLNLGRVYEQQKRYRRAASRYEQALKLKGLSAEDVKEAKIALKRVKAKQG